MRLLNVASSTLFLSNALAALYQNKLVYALLFFTLVLTSWLAHGTEHPFIGYLDKLVVYAVVAYGAYLVYKKGRRADLYYLSVGVATFLATVVLYCYGACTGTFCYDHEYGQHYHALMHGFSSVGHHALLLL